MTDTSDTTETPSAALAADAETVSVQPSPADAVAPAFFETLPDRARPYLSLARIDRPVGIWLLALPCWIGLAFARIGTGFQWIDIFWAIAFGIGAVAMRGAGCTWNDITDREIDAKVARTAARPLPSGAISLRDAYIFLGAQLAIGFLVWLCLPLDAKIVAFLAIPLVAAYPFMKRITFWPQAWLGLTFNWGVLVAAATAAQVSLDSILLLIALALWTIAYDTIYAMEDREDDALIGIGSTARLFGNRAVTAIFCFHLLSAALIALSGAMVGAGDIGAITALNFLAHGLWQSARLKRSKEREALAVFKSNVWAGAIVLAGFALAAIT